VAVEVIDLSLTLVAVVVGRVVASAARVAVWFSV